MLQEISESCNVKIDRRPIHTINKEGEQVKVPDKISLYNSENQNYLSTMSKKSSKNLRTYEQFVTMLNEGIGDTLGEGQVEDRLWGDAMFSRIVQFPEHKFTFGVKKGNEDTFNLTLWAWTSYSLQWAEQFIFGAICVRCLNGMYNSKWSIKGMSKKNWTSKANLKSSDITKAVEAFSKYPEMLEPMCRSKIDGEQVEKLFKVTLAYRKGSFDSKSFSEKDMKELASLWTKYEKRYGSNLYSAYQTATDWATHSDRKGVKKKEEKENQKNLMNTIRKRSVEVSNMLKSTAWSSHLVA